ncbi:universal stress protein UspF [Citrobacter amalonaticus]|uniref:Universal stress protein F n=1 Tax=Citrobacter amalonaticus TaxID=35703 RepID=A0A2S4RYQ8_CITAM|nr:universal stress protein UspF [Citrobacter amalonaticus]POT57667.1 universal stress protein UspF [Citrobacter amalonaticus]POT76806.1 universal stress protein UspF [Citrobacter amalonaticus]POU65885.1 universal stress protein UspF [Citrobacter amalonaticus]POV06042.1 universal stress protein UspF [Citrobacter amalonaticus]
MYRSILVPIDISEVDLTRQVIPQVEAHAKAAKVHFLAVIPSVPFYASLGLAYSGEYPDKNGLRTKAQQKLDKIVKQFNIPAGRVVTHLVYGPPKDQILKLADSVSADLVIIASHRPGISTYLLGSTAAAVVRHAQCPVLVVR